jgi:cephalosporin hydroxylase
MLYKNVPIIKCPIDYVLCQMLIWEIKPDLIIEIGTNRGGSALYFADLLDMIGHGEIHTIDLLDLVQDDQVKKHQRIRFFRNGYQLYDLSNTIGFHRIMVIEDGSHTYIDVLNALHKFSNTVSHGSYFIVEDGIIDKLGWKKKYNGGPNRAIKEFITENSSYQIDRKICDMFGTNATFNTNGYLKRIK